MCSETRLRIRHIRDILEFTLGHQDTRIAVHAAHVECVCLLLRCRHISDYLIMSASTQQVKPTAGWWLIIRGIFLMIFSCILQHLFEGGETVVVISNGGSCNFCRDAFFAGER